MFLLVHVGVGKIDSNIGFALHIAMNTNGKFFSNKLMRQLLTGGDFGSDDKMSWNLLILILRYSK